MPASFLLLVSTLVQAPGGSPLPPREVTVELRNGSRIDGVLIEEEPGTWVIGAQGGELRLSKRSVLRVVDKPTENEAPKAPSPAQDEALPGAPSSPPPTPPGQVTIELPSPAPMSFQIPEAWTEKKLAGRDLALTDPTQSMLFGVTTVDDPHSLWSFTRAIKRDYQRLYGEFLVEREKFSASSSLQTWEVEFRYEKDKQTFREVHLMLDFGETKRIFAFTAAAGRFESLIPRFRGIVNTFEFPVPLPLDCEGAANLAA